MFCLYRPTPKAMVEFGWASGTGLGTVLVAWLLAQLLGYAEFSALGVVLPWMTVPLAFSGWLSTDLEENKFQGGVTVQFFLVCICGIPIWDQLPHLTTFDPRLGCLAGSIGALAILAPWPVRGCRILWEQWRHHQKVWG